MRSAEPAAEQPLEGATSRDRAVSAPRPAAPGDGRPAGRGRTLRAFVALTKPRIIELLLWTTVPTMILAADGWPGLWLTVATLVGGTAAAGSANAFNMYFD
ncbi:protoheme IX farnesyltransferase, partial [Georgenia sp. 10Sc9-8]|nr:protoheme IX farnesyltransferase [Georgenia halotolerans]